MTNRRYAILLVVVSLFTLFGWPVRADDLADEADLHFRLATEKYAARDFRGALEQFLVSNRLVPNRNVIFNIARTYEQLQEFPDAFRYYVQALDLETDATNKPRIEEAISRIQPNVAVINVATTPPGATVYINRRDLGPRGNTPRLLGFPAGTYKVIVDLEGYEPKEVDGVEAKIGEQRTIDLKLERIVGKVRVVSETAGAAVRVDDPGSAPECTAPCDLILPPGRHRLYISQEGYTNSEQDVTVIARSEVVARYRLNPLSGSLVVNADERDALVEVDGKPVGFTPAVLNVQSGPRKVRVSLRGFRAVEQTVSVVPNQQTRIDISLRQLEEVEAASRTAEAVEDAPGSVSVIPGQELRAMGYPTIAEALRGTRGVYITNDSTYTFLGVRGVSLPGDFGNRILVLLNGQPTNDSWVGISYLDYSARTDLEDVERIEIVRGPGSVLYGTGAFSGVVNVVTKGRPTSAGAGVGAGTSDNSFFRGRGSVQLPFGRDSGMWVSVGGGRGLGRDYYFPQLAGGGFDGYSRDADHFNVGTVQGRIWVKSLSAQVFLTSRSKALPAGSVGTAVGDDRTSYRDTRGFVELKFEPQISRQFGLLARVALNYMNFRGLYWYDPDPGFTQIAAEENFDGRWGVAELRAVVNPIEQLRLTVGGEAQVHVTASQRGEETDCYTDGTCDTYLYLPGADPGTFDDSTVDAHPYQIFAGYALADLIPSERLRLSAGARIDYYNYAENNFSAPSPRVALIVKPYEQGNLKVIGGRGFRAPSIFENFYQAYQWTIPPNGDQHLTLEPETVWSGEAEFTHRFSTTVSATAAGHVSFLQNLIALDGVVSDPNNPAVVAGDAFLDDAYYLNTDSDILVVGGEAELRREWRQGWMAGLSYSFARARYQGEAPLEHVPNSPEHTASARGAVPLFGKMLTLATRLTFEGPRYDANVDGQELTEPAFIWDVALSGQLDRGNFSYNVGVYNVADWKYTVPVSPDFAVLKMPQNGRTFLMSANLSF